MADDRPRVGISSCLLGAPVRFDGGHKRDAFLAETLGRFVEWVPVCPEVEAGFGTPREPMQLTRVGSAIALVVVRTGQDVTPRVRRYAAARVGELASARLSGFVLKKDSPSCGMTGVNVHRGAGAFERTGRGLFADALMARLPDLPVEEEGRLGDPAIREDFIERVFAHHRLGLAQRNRA